MTVQSSSRLYLARLDHLRFLAALMVLCWHAVHIVIPTSYVPRFFFLSILEDGHTGVALFMVLSGFIFMALCREKAVVYADFIRNRLLRIAPLFVFFLTLQACIVPNLDALRAVFAYLTLIDQRAVPGGGWTILVEFKFYLLFPFLLLFYRQQGLRFLLGVLLVAFVFRLATWFATGSVRSLSYGSIFGRIDQFLLGMLACEWYHRRPAFFRSAWLLGGSVLVWLLLFHQFNRRGGYYNYNGLEANSLAWVFIPTLEGAFYALWTMCWLACPISLPRWLDNGLAWLGKLSFSFYLNHMLIVTACYGCVSRFGWMPTTFGSALLFTLLAVLPLTTLVSALTYYVIELPFLSLRRNYLVAPKQEQAPARLAA